MMPPSDMPRPKAGTRAKNDFWWATLTLAGWGLLLTGCQAPVGADRVSPRQVYEQVEANALGAGRPSADTVSLLHRYDLDALAAAQPVAAVRRLHEKALATGDRDLLFALAEVSYLAGEKLRRNVKPWETLDARDYYLGAAVYAGLFLFGEGRDARPDAFDRRFRFACDLYNYGLGWALGDRDGTNAIVQLAGGHRRLPVGEIELRFSSPSFPWPVEQFENFLVADQFRVRGVSVRNRSAGVGTPLIAVRKLDLDLRFRGAVPATVFLRVTDSLARLAAGPATATLELYCPFDETHIRVGAATVPLETDLTAPTAYTLNQSFIWQLERLQFFSPGQGLRSQLLLSQPYRPGRVPVVFVHGTFSSPVWWAEMVNTLNADPILRERYQIWQFLYRSSNPLMVSAAELRAELTATVQRLDPDGKDAALRQMVVIGHSQGGLLAKLTATDTGDQLWRVLSDTPLADTSFTEAQRELIRHSIFLKPLPFVGRVVFISTPHRGSYMAGDFVRNLVRKFVSLPEALVKQSSDFLKQSKEVKLPASFRGKMPTSVDGMSPKSPFLLKLAELPVAPPIKANSIIAIKGADQPPGGSDGVVKYSSAHVDYVESELLVGSGHSCQDKPATIEEVRRILHEHLKALPPVGFPQTR
ncbi:MAG: alpha/beta fold hydrolase [Verrucomicrobia subdivision 3 bacterium]|nr:alpha/beta fold hydrolase [Limisphaerales bacterium]